MSSTDYIEVTAIVQPQEPWTDLLIEELAEIGFESFEENPQGFKAYIARSEYDADKLTSVKLWEDTAGECSFHFSIEVISSRNWNKDWESNFKPVDVDGKCYIRAPFHEAKSGHDYELVIEPKMSFGTGHHHTTYLMAQWMLETDFKSKKVLDMGCGTGILAILAEKMGASQVIAIDNYAFAYENTLENIEINAAKKVEALLGDAQLLGEEKYDIILANITKNVLKEDMATYVKAMNNKGLIFISGFFAVDMQELTELAESLGLAKIAHKQKDEWAAVKFSLEQAG